MCKLILGGINLLACDSEQIVGTTKTSISLDDSLLMFPTLTLTFSHSVGWLVTSFPNVFIKSDSLPGMVKLSGRVRVA